MLPHFAPDVLYHRWCLGVAHFSIRFRYMGFVRVCRQRVSALAGSAPPGLGAAGQGTQFFWEYRFPGVGHGFSPLLEGLQGVLVLGELFAVFTPEPPELR